MVLMDEKTFQGLQAKLRCFRLLGGLRPGSEVAPNNSVAGDTEKWDGRMKGWDGKKSVRVCFFNEKNQVPSYIYIYMNLVSALGRKK